MMLVVISLLLFHLIGLLQKVCFPRAAQGGALKPTTSSSQSGYRHASRRSRPSAQSFDVARRAWKTAPIRSAPSVGPDGEVLLEQGNAYMPDHDMTGHAERVLMTRASTRYTPEFLALHHVHVRRTLRHVRGCRLLGRSWARGLRPFRAQPEGPHRQPSGKPDAGFAVPHRLRRRPAQGRGARPAAGGRGGRLHEGIW